MEKWKTETYRKLDLDNSFGRNGKGIGRTEDRDLTKLDLGNSFGRNGENGRNGRQKLTQNWI